MKYLKHIFAELFKAPSPFVWFAWVRWTFRFTQAYNILMKIYHGYGGFTGSDKSPMYWSVEQWLDYKSPRVKKRKKKEKASVARTTK